MSKWHFLMNNDKELTVENDQVNNNSIEDDIRIFPDKFLKIEMKKDLIAFVNLKNVLCAIRNDGEEVIEKQLPEN